MSALRQWWNRLLGRGQTPDPTTTRSGMRAEPARKKATEPAHGSGLQLASGSNKPQKKRVGAAGFDPYGNDAGFSKPHSWERIDHD